MSGAGSRACARCLSDSDAAADVVQETWLGAFSRIDQLREPGAFAGRLRSIARNKCIDEQRRRARPPQHTDEETSAPVEPVTEPIYDYLDMLAPGQRDVAIAYYVDRTPIVDIAQSLERPLGTIKSRLHHARRALRVLLEP